MRRLIEGTGARWVQPASGVEATGTSRVRSTLESGADEDFEDHSSWSPRERGYRHCFGSSRWEAADARPATLRSRARGFGRRPSDDTKTEPLEKDESNYTGQRGCFTSEKRRTHRHSVTT